MCPQLRRRLPPLPLALVTALAVFPLPEEQPVHHAPGPCPHPVPRPAVTARGQGFVRPAAEERIEELVNGDQRSLAVGHTYPSKAMTIAFNSSAVAAALMASLKAHLRAYNAEPFVMISCCMVRRSASVTV